MMSAPTVADLHLHSRHSDGVLEPEALIELCAARGVSLLALTDHDTLEGCAAARAACAARGLRNVTGVEISCGWNGQTLHLIGLGFDEHDADLGALLAGIRERRRTRIAEMGERLERKARLPGRALAAAVLANDAVATRQHLARALVEAGHAGGIGDAFERWLARGRPGHAPASWPELAEVVAVLRAAGGRPVLAHPHRYKLSAGAMRRLLGEFRDAGGEAIEVAVAGIGPSDLDRLATLARNHRLAASTGSDFHDPAVPWNTPGRFAKLPADLEPLAARLA
jgi:predicted metal-dependent phosphoesterase TrpH